MEEEREGEKDRAIEFAKQHAIHKVFETSAKTGDMVEEVFSCAAKELFVQTEKEEDGTPDVTPSTTSGTGEPTKGAGPQRTKLKKGKQGGVVKKKGGCC